MKRRLNKERGIERGGDDNRENASIGVAIQSLFQVSMRTAHAYTSLQVLPISAEAFPLSPLL